MGKPKFSKAPTSAIDRELERKAKEFINQSETSTLASNVSTFKKEKTKPLYLRAPISLWDDIHEIMARSGLSMNAICLDLLRPEIKRKLKDLKAD